MFFCKKTQTKPTQISANQAHNNYCTAFGFVKRHNMWFINVTRHFLSQMKRMHVRSIIYINFKYRLIVHE